MAFVTYSGLVHGVPESDAGFSEEDTYVTVISCYSSPVGGGSLQDETHKAIKKLFNVLYEGPPSFNHFHGERRTPSQILVIFEKKCQPGPNPAQDVLKMEKTPEETT